MYTCALHIKLKNSPKIYHFHAVNSKRIRDLIPWPPGSICILYLVKVANDFIQKSQTLEALLVDVILVIKFFVVGYRGKHDSNVFISFAV